MSDAEPDAHPEPIQEPQTLEWDRWTRARFVAQSRLPQVAAFIPAIGYAILWSDQFSLWLEMTRLPGGLPVELKLHFLWWGAMLMAGGLALYVWKCPGVIKRAAAPEDYVLEQFQAPNPFKILDARLVAMGMVAGYHPGERRPLLRGGLSPYEVNQACDNAKANSARLTRQQPGYVHPIFVTEYHAINHDLPGWRRSTVLLLWGGALIFLIPSLEVTIRVLWKLAQFGAGILAE